MNISSHTLWSIWHELSLLSKLFTLILAVISAYSVISAGIVLKQVRTLAAPSKSQDRNPIQQQITALNRRCLNLRQILAAASFLFGFLFFCGLPSSTHTLGGFPAWEILGNFVLNFIYAANVFFVFLVLHVIQWIVSSRVQAFTRELDI